MSGITEPSGYSHEDATFKKQEQEALAKIRAELDAKRQQAAAGCSVVENGSLHPSPLRDLAPPRLSRRTPRKEPAGRSGGGHRVKITASQMPPMPRPMRPPMMPMVQRTWPRRCGRVRKRTKPAMARPIANGAVQPPIGASNPR